MEVIVSDVHLSLWESHLIWHVVVVEAIPHPLPIMSKAQVATPRPAFGNQIDQETQIMHVAVNPFESHICKD